MLFPWVRGSARIVIQRNRLFLDVSPMMCIKNYNFFICSRMTPISINTTQHASYQSHCKSVVIEDTSMAATPKVATITFIPFRN